MRPYEVPSCYTGGRSARGGKLRDPIQAFTKFGICYKITSEEVKSILKWSQGTDDNQTTVTTNQMAWTRATWIKSYENSNSTHQAYKGIGGGAASPPRPPICVCAGCNQLYLVSCWSVSHMTYIQVLNLDWRQFVFSFFVCTWLASVPWFDLFIHVRHVLFFWEIMI